MTRIRTLTIALAMGLVGLIVAGAQTSDDLFRDFEPDGDWLLSVDGREVPAARIYDSSRAQALLLLTSEFPSPVLIDRGGRSVAVLNMMKVAERPDGTIDLLADAVLEPAGGFTVRNRTDAHFRVAGKAAILSPRPWKLGPQAGAGLLDADPGYRWRAKRYEPDAAAFDRLRSEKRDVRVLTFFGSWCPHCKEHLPYLLKIEQRLAGEGLRFDYYGLPSNLASEPQAVEWRVDGVPTAIVLVDGTEVGRIPARQWSNPEIALDMILARGRR
jgi:thiol-disulfide isomerase/thioredoxin